METTLFVLMAVLSGCLAGRTGSTDDVTSAPTTGEDSGQDWTSDATFHILSILEQVNSKLDRLEVTAGSCQVDIKDTEQRLGSKLTSELSHMEDKINLQLMQQNGQGQGKSQSGGDIDVSQVKNELVKLSNRIMDNVTDSLEMIRQAIGGYSQLIPATLAGPLSRDDDDDNVGNQLESLIDSQIGDLNADLVQKINTKFVAMETELRALLTNQSAMSVVNDAALQAALKEVVQPTSCKKGMVAAPYTVIYPPQDSVISVPYVCDSKTSQGGWIVLQRRQSGREIFDRSWDEYRAGFGLLNDEFWLGLEAVHNLTNSATYELRIDLVADGKPYYAEYATFAVASETENFVLQIGEYSGTSGDKLNSDKWMPFSAKDKDNDNSGANCAKSWKSGWWYNNCGYSGLNKPNPQLGGLRWYGLSSVTFSEMKMRLVNQP